MANLFEKWRSALAVLLSFSLALPCRADAPARPRVTAEHYAECDDILKLEASGALEQTIVERTATPEQALQLLFDYKLVLSSLFANALRFTLQDRGLAFTGLTGKGVAAQKEIRHLVSELNGVARLPDSGLRPLVADILIRARQLATSDRTLALRVSRLTGALLTLPENNPFEKMMIVMIRQSLLLSAMKGVESLARDFSPGRLSNPLAIFGLGVFVFNSVAGVASSLHQFVQTRNDFFYPREDLWDFMGNVIVILLASAVTGGAMYVLGTLATEGYRNQPEEAHRRVLKAVRPYESQLISFRVQDSRSGALAEKMVPDILNFFEGELDNGVLSLKSACGFADTCSLSPTEIAYLGHAERAALFDLEQAQDKNWLPETEKTERARLLMAAQSLAIDSDNYDLQIALIHQLGESVQTLRAASLVQKQKIKSLSAAVQDVRSSVHRLASLPYKNLAPEHVPKNKLLREKIEGDLDQLRSIDFDARDFGAQIKSVYNKIQVLEGLKRAAPTTHQGWLEFASRAQTAIEKFEIGEGR